MTLRATISLVLAASLAAGCATNRAQRLATIPAEIERGKTTRPEVRTLLGEPNWKSTDPGGEVWVYGDRPKTDTESFVVNEAVGVGSSFIPVPFAGTAVRAILFAGKKNRKPKPSATVAFDRRGVVSDYAVDLPVQG